MENITNDVYQTPINQPAFVPERRKTNYLIIALLLVIFVMFLAGAYYLGRQSVVKPELLTSPPVIEISPTTRPVAILPSSVQTPTLIPTVDPMSGWKTYTNKVRNYSMNYPKDWLLDTTEAETPINSENGAKLVISKGRYQITVLWPSAFGPGICLFDDESRNGAPEMADYCKGEYIETKNNDSTIINRRLVLPETLTDHVQWNVYTKEKIYFVTVPPIRFIAPLDYNTETIHIMDQILSTFKFTK